MQQQRSSGFSLVELMVSIVILSIMATAAVTGLMELVRTVRVKSATQNLFVSTTLARSEAAKRNMNVTMSPVDADNWAAGWDVVAGGTLIFRQQALRGVTITQGPDDVTYNRHGRLPDGVLAPEFQIQTDTGDQAVIRCLEIDIGGRASIVKGECP